jgi:hypothetical protein
MHVVHANRTYMRSSPKKLMQSFSIKENSYGDRNLGQQRPFQYQRSIDPSKVEAAGKRLTPKRDENVLIIN